MIFLNENETIEDFNPDSILDSVKKYLGITVDYTQFDPDVIMAINMALYSLWTLGIGPKELAYRITDRTSLWDNLVQDRNIEMCQSYVFLRVKLLFDPPTNSFLVENIKEQIREFEFRMMVGEEEYEAKEE